MTEPMNEEIVALLRSIKDHLEKIQENLSRWDLNGLPAIRCIDIADQAIEQSMLDSCHGPSSTENLSGNHR
jgi:hypothetical protein